MRLAMIACEIMIREVSALIAGLDHIVSVRWLKQGLHDTPALLHQLLEEKIAEIEEQNEMLPPDKRFDAIVLGYGLCSNSVAGLGSRSLPLVVPKCDDCVALFLGSQERYLELFYTYKGSFWYSAGGLEMASDISPETCRRQLAEYTELYGEENAAFLVEQSSSWVKNYRYAIYIKSPVYHREKYSDYCRAAANGFGWEYREVEGKLDYFTDLLSGNWSEERFVICPPGKKLEATYDSNKLRPA